MAHTYSQSGSNKTFLVRRQSFIANVIILAVLIFIAYSIIIIATQLHQATPPHFSINLSPLSLPYYAILSTGRMAIAYIIALSFSFMYARIAVTNKKAEGIMIPILDVLQSIPILSFMPGVVLALVAIFPHSNIGLEIAAIILIFTSQAWNITFGFYQTLLTIPSDLKDVAIINHLNFWQRFTRLEIPAGMISLIWNSMMSWAGGWFFLMASEQFTLGHKSFQLPGLGSYLQAAANKGNIPDLFLGLGMLIFVIVFLDQMMWRPLVAWGDRFKLEQDESDDKPRSWFLQQIQESPLIQGFFKITLLPLWNKVDGFLGSIKTTKQAIAESNPRIGKQILQYVLLVFVASLIILAIIGTFGAVHQVTLSEWKMIFFGSGATLLRTMSALVISALWTVPVGVAIGLNPSWAKRVQPLVQMAASIPATALFPAILLVLLFLPAGLSIAAIILMLLGTQWYVLFNVIAGAMAIPNDLREATAIYHITGWMKWKTLILPAIFPYLVTGMITATGGAWNASIVSEYVTFNGKVHSTVGLGADIARAANTSNFHFLLAATLTMAVLVFCINRFGWQRIYRLAEDRFHFE
jgi:NitT/TauT family transport system permease protein